MLLENKIHYYQWEGINKRGLRVKGQCVASNPIMVHTELSRQNIDPLSIRKKVKIITGKIKKTDIILFGRHLSVLISSGSSLTQALDILARSQNKLLLQSLMLTIKTDVESGQSFSKALSKHSSFNELFCHLISVGEESGSLEIMLEHISAYLEKIENLKKKIQKALFYPITIMTFSFIVGAALLLFIIPQFEQLFNAYGARLPFLTHIVIVFSNLLQKRGWILFVLFFSCIGIFFSLKKRSTRFNRSLDHLLIHLPLIGKLIRQSIIARLMRTLAIMISAGVPMIDALQLLVGIANNAIYQKAIEQIREDVARGQSLYKAMDITQLFPPMLIQMITVAEEASTLPITLDKIANFYEEDVDNKVNSVSHLFEPIVMIILGVIVGGFVISLYLPIFKLGSII